MIEVNKFVSDLNIPTGRVVLMTENSMALLSALKKLRGASDYSIAQLFNLILDALVEKIGTDGTLLIQTFDWSFCNGKPFDIKNVNSKTSFLGKIALERKDFARTKHPIYSFAVTGKYQEILTSIDNVGAFDHNSPFAFAYRKNGVMAIIDIPLHGSFTFCHHVEQMERASYRYNKSFTSLYRDLSGDQTMKTYDMYVRDISKNVKADLFPLENLFIEHAVMKKHLSLNLEIRQVDLVRAYQVIRHDILHNNGMSLHTIGR